MQLDALAAAVDGLHSLDTGDLSAAEFNELLVELQAIRNRLDAVEARLTGQWDARRCWQDDGARTAKAWLGSRCRVAPATAGRRVATARAMRDMQHTADAWAAAEISVDHVWELIRSARTADTFSDDEKMLVDQARDRSLKYAEFTIAQAYWRQLADPDGTERAAGAQHGHRRLHLNQTAGGWWYGEFGLDPIHGAIVSDTLTGIEAELFRTDWATGEPTRTPEQRRADALVEMATRARTAPADGQRPRPLFTTLVGYETLHGRICELAGATVIAPGSLIPYLDQAEIERVVFAGPSRVVDVGKRTRLYTGALRRAIQVRDRFCYHPTCDIGSDRCQIDHDLAYADGGETTQTNGRPACDHHNRLREKDRRGRHPPGARPP